MEVIVVFGHDVQAAHEGAVVSKELYVINFNI